MRGLFKPGDLALHDQMLSHNQMLSQRVVWIGYRAVACTDACCLHESCARLLPVCMRVLLDAILFAGAGSLCVYSQCSGARPLRRLGRNTMGGVTPQRGHRPTQGACGRYKQAAAAAVQDWV